MSRRPDRASPSGSGLSLTRWRQRSRVLLRPPTDVDREALGIALGGPGGELTAIARREDGAVIGALAHRRAGGWLVVADVAVAAASRGRGYEAEAIRMLEEDAAARGIRRFGFAARKSEGLALYFALRLGYRPAAPGEAIWRGFEGRDIIAMVRNSGGRA